MMKINYFVQCLGVVALTLSATMIPMESVAGNFLTSGETKKIRNVSRTLLQSNAIERKRIEAEIVLERSDISKMEDSLGRLIASELSAMSKVTLESINNANNTASVLIKDGSVVQLPGMNAGVKGQGSAMSDIARKTREDRIKRIQVSKNDIANVRVAVEHKLPSKYAFWKTKTKRDVRNEHIVRVAKSVEKELMVMSQLGRMDIKKLRELKDKVTLRRPDIDYKDIDPTFQTRTHHRAQ
ncbi:MAG: hypothetical protein OQK32_06745 [Gammaproteobacteria bacterium]|nr:hypothetical protein [Gammaproteobacteria bacterium]